MADAEDMGLCWVPGTKALNNCTTNETMVADHNPLQKELVSDIIQPGT